MEDYNIMGLILKYTAPNGKFYIGSAKTTPSRRAKDEYGIGYIATPIFWQAIKTYKGLQNFQLDILEEDVSLEQLEEKELYYIEKFNNWSPNGYNFHLRGFREEELDNRKIDQYEENGQKIATFPSMKAAAETNQCTIEGIEKALKKMTPSAKGFFWTYENEEPVFRKIKNQKRIYQFDLKGNLIREFERPRNADSYYKMKMGTAARCAERIKKTRIKRVGQYVFTFEPFLDRKYYNVL